MKRPYLLVLSAAFLIPLVPRAARSEEPPINIRFARPLGMGSAFTAVANDLNVFAFNPAGLGHRTQAELVVGETAIGYSADLEDGVKFLSTKEGELQDWNNLSAERRATLRGTIKDDIRHLAPHGYAAEALVSYLSGPTVGNHAVRGAIGLLGGFDGRFSFREGEGAPIIGYRGTMDFVVPVIAAKRFTTPNRNGYFTVGATTKFLQRHRVARDIPTNQVTNLESPPFARGYGAGLDLGLLYQPTSRTAWGAVIQDLGGTQIHYQRLEPKNGYPFQAAHTSVIRPRTNAGLAHRPRTLFWLPTQDRVTLAADLHDAFNSESVNRDFERHAHLGVEYKVSFFSVRAGVSNGYPTLGLGVDDKVIRVQYAHYTTDVDRSDGSIRESNDVFSVGLRFGVGSERRGHDFGWNDGRFLSAKVRPVAATEETAIDLRPVHQPWTPYPIKELSVKEEPVKPRIYEIRENETLDGLARRFYGNSRLWTKIYYANKHLIDNPEKLKPGTRIVVPN